MFKKVAEWLRKILGIKAKAKQEPECDCGHDHHDHEKASEAKGLSEVSAGGVVQKVEETVKHAEHNHDHVEVREEIKVEKAE
jgi:hypothetical protein